MKRKLGILFDLDGTLVDLNPDQQDLEKLRTSFITFASNAGVSLRSKGIFSIYQQVITECAFDHPVSEYMRRELDSFEKKWARYRSAVNPNTEFLGKLRGLGHILAIVTNNGTACVQALFDFDKLKSEWFDFSITRDDVTSIKPSSIPIENALDFINKGWRDISDFIFVGDSENDRLAVEAFNRKSALKIIFVKVESGLERGYDKEYCSSLCDFLKEFAGEE